jgi:hypothetical protein
MDVELHIDTLVLDAAVLERLGLSGKDAAAVGRAVEGQLARMLATQAGGRPSRNLPGASLPDASVPRLAAAPLALPPGSTAATLGAGIAASVMGGLRHG